MHYEPGTGSFQNDYLDEIFNTGYLFDVPYKINREKYEAIAKKWGMNIEIKDADVVMFHCDYDYEDSDNANSELYRKVLFVWPENSPEGSKDWHECFYFGKYEDHNVTEFEDFVREMVTCIIEADKELCLKFINERIKERNTLNQNIEKLFSQILKG